MADVTINLEGCTEAFSVVVEPWACPVFQVGPRERCSVVVHHPFKVATVSFAVAEGMMYITVHESGATFSFLREGVAEFTLPIPSL